MKHHVPVEIRESREGPRLHATVIQEGRAAAGGRRELFTPFSVLWPDNGIAIRTVHRGPTQVRAMPVRSPNGELRIAAKANPEIVAAVADGKVGMSVEFRSLREQTTKAGVREITRAFVDGAALVRSPEYAQGVAEVRERQEDEGAYRWL